MALIKLGANAITALPTGVGGKVLQVVNTIKTDAFSASVGGASSANITGLAVNITPSSSSNKILINAQVNATNSGGVWHYFHITRGGTKIGIGDQHGSNRQRETVFVSPYNTDTNDSGSLQILDTPNSTSQQTYQVVIQNGAGSSQTLQVNTNNSSDLTSRASFACTITAMEIAG